LKRKFILFCLFLFSNTILGAYSLNYHAGDSLSVNDSVEQNRYSNLKSIWGFRLGYFFDNSDEFNSMGLSGTFYNEYAISKFFNLGWSLQINQAINNNGGYLYLGGILSYPLRIEKQVFYVRGGLGLGAIGGLTRVGFFEIEYLIWEFEKSAISISISECIPEFKKLMPPVISIGILF